MGKRSPYRRPATPDNEGWTQRIRRLRMRGGTQSDARNVAGITRTWSLAMHAMKPVAATLLILALLPGCKDREAEAGAQAAAATAASEQAAADAERAFEGAVADGNWALAKAQGDILFA